MAYSPKKVLVDDLEKDFKCFLKIKNNDVIIIITIYNSFIHLFI